MATSNDFKCKETVVMQLWMQKRDKTYLKNSMLDRSPCGTGSIALATKFWQSGVLAIGNTLHTESIVGSSFSTKLKAVGKPVGPYDQTVICEVTGNAHIYSFNKLILHQ